MRSINSRHSIMSCQAAKLCSAPVFNIFWKRKGGQCLGSILWYHTIGLGSCSPDLLASFLGVKKLKLKKVARINESGIIVTHTKVLKRILESSVLLLSATLEGQLEHWSPSSDRRKAKPETQKVLQSVLHRKKEAVQFASAKRSGKEKNILVESGSAGLYSKSWLHCIKKRTWNVGLVQVLAKNKKKWLTFW